MIRGLLLFLFVLASIHVGYIFASPVIKNKMLEGKMKEVAKESALKGESQIRRDVMRFVEEKDIPLSENQLVIVNQDRKLTISAHYSSHAEFWFYQRDYEFFAASHPSAKPKPSSQRRGTVRAGH
jgi:hypothetical protein